MSQFLEEWVCKRLGVSINFDNAGSEFFDGKLFFKILQSYNVVKSDLWLHFREAATEEDALNNLYLLRVCFKLLGVLQDDGVLEEISRKNGSASLKLLNELYCRLSDRHSLPLVTKGKKKQVFNQETGRFHKTKVPEKKCILPEKERPEERLLSQLKNAVNVFSNYKKEVFDKYKNDCQQRLIATSESTKKEIKTAVEECKCGVTVEECLKIFDQNTNDLMAKGDFQLTPCPPDEYIAMLKLRTLKHTTDKETELKLKNLVITRLQCKQQREREQEYRCSLAEKLSKQSKYEKEMGMRLGKIHLQHRLFTENRRRAHEVAQQLYRERLESKQWRTESSGDSEFDKEKRRLHELHKKIFSEKIAKLRQERYYMIQCVVSDIVDLSIKIAQFEIENSLQVPVRFLKEWKVFFYKSLPLFPRKEKTYNDEGESEDGFVSIIEEGGEGDGVLNENNLNEYLIQLGPWLKELWPELENFEEEQSVLGFVVHRLLEFKYPFPEPPKAADVPLYPIRAVLNNIVDEKAIKVLRSLLEKPRIEVIEVPVVINYCVTQYKKEAGLEVPAAGKQKKDNKLAKEIKSKEVKGKKGNKSVVIESPTKSVEVQFPSVGEVAPLVPELTKLAVLGKKAFDILSLGSPLPANLMVEIIIAYINNLEESGGWVLINFPADCKQVFILEQTFSGLQAPIQCEESSTTVVNESDIQENNTSPGPSLTQENKTSLGPSLTQEKNTSLGHSLTQENNTSPGPSLTQENKTSLGPSLTQEKNTSLGHSLTQENNTSLGHSLTQENNTSLGHSPSNCDNEESSSTNESNDSESMKTMDQLRISRLVPRPNPPPPEYPFTTYFTHFIDIDLQDNIVVEINKGKKTSKVPTIQEESQGSLRETNSEQEEKENEINESQTPSSFYENTDIFILFPYTKLDFITIKKLARVILNESNETTLERKTSEELFGEAANVVNKKERKSKSGKDTSKASVEKSAKVKMEIPEPVEIEDIPEAEEIVIPPVVVPPCEVAQPCWKYTTLPVSNDFQLVLASLWETIELTYIQNLKELFYFYRVHDSCVVPYRNFVFDKLTTLMDAPDERQTVVSDFQEELNCVQDFLRPNGDVKKELFCRIFEVQLKLWDLCDGKKTECEEERKEIISQNWLAKHMCGLCNNYISMMETECDRFIDTLQLLQDYYLLSLGKSLQAERFEKFCLPRFKLSDFGTSASEFNESSEIFDDISLLEKETTEPLPEISAEVVDHHNSVKTSDSASNEKQRRSSQKSRSKSSLGKKNNIALNSGSKVSEPIIKRQLDIILSTDGISDHLTEFLTNTTAEVTASNPYLENVSELKNIVANEISELTNGQFVIIEKEKKQFLPLTKANPRKTSTVKKKRVTKSIISMTSNKSEALLKENNEADEQRESFLKAGIEWRKAVENEMDRTIFRITLIYSRLGSDVAELEDLMRDTFHSMHNEIATRYYNQARNCDCLIRILMASVEAESKIEPKLFLTLDKFFVSSSESTFPVTAPPPVTPIYEKDQDYTFTVEQLDKLAKKLIQVSALGISIESLIAIVEDMALLGKENGYPYLPKCWSQLNRCEIRKVIEDIFGDATVLVDWKDLLVFALNFRFPTLQEIVDMRNQFSLLDRDNTETVALEDYLTIDLWFEKDLGVDIEEDLRIVLGKQFLFNLYGVDENSMNYTAFLLNYCKDANPVDGFGKALALVTGTGYILDEDNLYLLTKTVISDSQIIAEQIMDILLLNTLNWAEGTVVTEVDDDGNPIIDIDEEEYVNNDYNFFNTEKLLDHNGPEEDKTNSQSNELLDSLKSFHSAVDESQLKDTLIWKSWLPRSLVLSLLMTSHQAYALSEDQFYLQGHIEDSLQKLFAEKGTSDCIPGHILIQTEFIKDLFSKCYKFKSCDLIGLIKSVFTSKEPSSVGELF